MTNVKRIALLAVSALLVAAAGDQEDRLSEAFGAYLAGRFAVQSHDLTIAAEQYATVLREDPGISELNSQAFLAALLSGQKQTAALAEKLTDNPLAQLVLADRDGKNGHWAAAEGRFAALPEQQVLTQVLRPLLVAWAQQAQGNSDAALATLAPFANGQRFRGVYALHAAMIADLAGKNDEAAKLYQAASSDYGAANLRLGMILASWQARQGELAAAKRTIDDMTGADSDLAMARPALEADISKRAVASAADGIAEAYLALAATLRQQSAETAQIMVRLALDMRPDLTAARILLAEIEDADKQPEAALTTLAAVAASDPLAPLVQLRKAVLLDEDEQSDAAVKILQQLAREHPDRPEPWAQQGDMLRRKNRFAEAAKDYAAAIERIGTPSRSNWPLFYARGIAYERAGDWPKAEQDLQYALKLSPDQPSVLNYLAYSWADRGEHIDEAKTMLERAIDARPNEGAFIDSLGWVLLRQGDTAGAVKQLEHAVELDPEDAVINGHLGDALAAAGRTREAEFQWRRALNLNPEPDDAKKLNEKLASLPAVLR
jgi:tetratricopeptide (TPR) repeat protein